jgi:hypothetical protein
MRIYGLSPTSGAEVVLDIERSGGGILLQSRGPAGGEGRARVVVPGAGLLAALVERPSGGTTVAGTAPAGATRESLDVEVRGNEVQLRVRPETGGEWDVAVGLDDFQDALEAVVTPD